MKTNNGYEMNASKIRAAFWALRKARYAAQMNFMCCGSCASSALHEVVENPAKPLRGAVYFTKQDTANARRSGRLFISYGACESANGVPNAGTATVAEDLIYALVVAGVPRDRIVWNSDTRTRIEVDFTDRPTVCNADGYPNA